MEYSIPPRNCGHRTDLQVEVNEPAERILVHGLDVGQIRDGEEQDTRVLSNLQANNNDDDNNNNNTKG